MLRTSKQNKGVSLDAVLSKPTAAATTKDEEQKNKKNEEMLGTSIMAMAYKGGVVIAADSRTSMDTYVANRVSDKLTPIHSRIFVARSGSAADTQSVADIVAYYLDLHGLELGTLPLVKTAASMAANMVYQYKDQLLAGLIIAGWDKQKGGQVYSVALGGALTEMPFAIGGSGSTYIYGLIDAEFVPNMSRNECQSFVRKALSHAIARDGSSGGVIRMVTIDEKGVTREMVPGDKLPYLGPKF